MPRSECVPLLSSIANVDAQCRGNPGLPVLRASLDPMPGFPLAFALAFPFAFAFPFAADAFALGCAAFALCRGSSGSCLLSLLVLAAGFDVAPTFGLGSLASLCFRFLHMVISSFDPTNMYSYIRTYIRTCWSFRLGPLRLPHSSLFCGRGPGRVHGLSASSEAQDAQLWQLVASARRDKVRF